MPNPDVSAIVSSIVAAFESGMNVFRRLQSKRKQSKLNKKTRKKKKATSDDAEIDAAVNNEEQRLHLSLQRGPRQILNSYEMNSGRFGDRFRQGDDLAQSSLTHTLLALNAGLMRIISSIMAEGPERVTGHHLARRSLLSLSERSALDTVSSLEDLCQRLMMESPRSALARQTHNSASGRRQHDSESSKRVAPLKQGQQQTARKRYKATGRDKAHTTSRPTNPALPEIAAKRAHRPEDIRGAWVRSRNGSSSTITVITSRPQPRIIVSGHRKRHEPSKPNDIASARSRTAVSVPNPPSTTNESSQPSLSTAASRTVRQTQQRTTIPPIPQQQSIPITDGNTTNNRVSILSISSGSTKLGEIPRHKWITPWEPPVDDESGDGDENASTEGEQFYRQKNKIGLRFWKRFGKNSNNVRTT